MTQPPSPCHGWVILDKPLGLGSTAAVARVKRALGAAKAGHGGTLDPLATGLLPVALGEATKTASFLVNGRKTYRFTVTWGAETSTDDGEGVVTEQSPHRPSPAEIEAMLPRFVGIIEQIPPAFSAIRTAGERSYALARQGRPVLLAARSIEIESLILADATTTQATFEARCGKGTYVRALARDLGRALGSRAHVSALRRTALGPFGEADMIPLDKIEDLLHKACGQGIPQGILRPLETVLDDIPALALSEAEAERLRRGMPVKRADPEVSSKHDMVLVLSGDMPVALASSDGGLIRPRRVFNLQRA
ncbi:MAG: tRNA pseudouridine(55) synthase TruB [Pseudomonadota bacterium]|nr:tRNA pseudouridine(55) synthase TruB [Pseudomonadota bacterium]